MVLFKLAYHGINLAIEEQSSPVYFSLFLPE